MSTGMDIPRSSNVICTFFISYLVISLSFFLPLETNCIHNDVSKWYMSGEPSMSDRRIIITELQVDNRSVNRLRDFRNTK